MSWFKRENWGHCATFKIQHQFEYINGYIYIHLYESEIGKRKFVVGSTHQKLKDRNARKEALKSDFYHERVVRWLGGRHDMEIPKYTERAEDDTVNALKGIY
jgi:hypothetical protein